MGDQRILNLESLAQQTREENFEQFKHLGNRLSDVLEIVKTLSVKVENLGRCQCTGEENKAQAVKIVSKSKDIEGINCQRCGYKLNIDHMLSAASFNFRSVSRCHVHKSKMMQHGNDKANSYNGFLNFQNHKTSGMPDVKNNLVQSRGDLVSTSEEESLAEGYEDIPLREKANALTFDLPSTSSHNFEKNETPKNWTSRKPPLRMRLEDYQRKSPRYSVDVRRHTMASSDDELADGTLCSPASSVFSCSECVPLYQCTSSSHSKGSIPLKSTICTSANHQISLQNAQCQQVEKQQFQSENEQLNVVSEEHSSGTEPKVSSQCKCNTCLRAFQEEDAFLKDSSTHNHRNKPILKKQFSVHSSIDGGLNLEATQAKSRSCQNSRTDLVSAPTEENFAKETILHYICDICHCFRSSGCIRPATMTSLVDDVAQHVCVFSPIIHRKKQSLTSTCSHAGCILALKQQSSSDSNSSQTCDPTLSSKFLGIEELHHLSSPAKDVVCYQQQMPPVYNKERDEIEVTSPALPFENEQFEHTSIISGAGVVGVAECKATFLKNTFNRTVKVKLACSLPYQISTDEGIIVTPEVTCVIADDVKPHRPFLLSMPTCYVNSQQHSDELLLEVQHRSVDERWQSLTTIKHGMDLFVEFSTDQLGRFRCIVPRKDCEKLSKNMISVVFLQHSNVQSKHDKFVWCVLDDMPYLEPKMWLEMTPRDMYERILPSKPFQIRYGQGLHLLVEDDRNDKESKVLNGDDVWNKNFYQKFEFPLSRSSKYIDGQNFSIRNDKQDLLLDYEEEGCIDLPVAPRKRNRSFIHDTCSVNSSIRSSRNSLENPKHESSKHPVCSRAAKFKSLVRSKNKCLRKQFSRKPKKSL